MCSVTKCVNIPLNMPNVQWRLVWSLDYCWALELSFRKYHFLPLHAVLVLVFYFLFFIYFFSYGKTGVYSKLRHEFVRVDLEISNMEMSTCPS